ncbi:MAG: tRNA preQ1(34) S-adenosylmethionine ribosyltransferase-isomerase QueA [Spirochaetales bacterium]
MKTNSFSFDLPEELIAQTPAERRDEARLLVSDRQRVLHTSIRDLPSVVPHNAVLVINDSRVRKARIFAARASTSPARAADPGDEQSPDNRRTNDAADTTPSVELLFLERYTPTRWSVMARRPGRNPERRTYELPGGITARLTRYEDQFILNSDTPLDEAWFERHGHIPLPPYVTRDDNEIDEERYQTVFAREPGSAAAPTAGLHLTESLLDRLSSNGTEIARITLHVGAGTFAPVRTDDIESHTMHSERYEVSETVAERVNRAKREGRPIVAVGTTSVRTLETAGASGELIPGTGESDLFIYPGYRFRMVDELLTNFHTPRSSLLMLVSAFAGKEHILSLYKQAVEMRYRFFSYGDAMYLRP